MTLQDAHLKQALLHAPDRDISPAEASRAAVLSYARQSIKIRKKSLYTPFQQWWSGWCLTNWQLTTAGSISAAVLVLFVFWHERPKDSEWADTASTNLAAGEAPVAAVQPDAIFSEGLKKREDAKTLEPPPVMLPADKTVIAEADHNESGGDFVAGKSRLGGGADKSEMPDEASVAMHDSDVLVRDRMPESPKITSIVRQSAAKGDMKEASSEAVKNAGVHSLEAVQLAGERAKDQERGMQPRRKDVAVAARAEVSDNNGNAALADALGKEGGQSIANRDISAGVLRTLYFEEHFQTGMSQACGQLEANNAPQVDSITGYRVETISSCYLTATLRKEVEIYNQTMRDWHKRMEVK